MLQSLAYRPSKFRPRPSSPRYVARPRLLARAGGEDGVRLVVVQAPAGFGKSTLLVQWHQHLAAQGEGVGWVQVDENDNDAGRFADSLCQALLPNLAGSTADLFDCINQCLETHGSFTLFIDEAECLTGHDAVHLLAVLLDNSPRPLRLVVASRALTAALATLVRLRADSVEINAAQMAFSREEIQAFMATRGCAALAEADYERLGARTEGWAAALQLASAAISRGEPPGRVIEHLAAPNTDLNRYVREELLVHLPAQDERFLLETSFLKELTGSLCNAVTGRDDSVDVLRRLEQGNLLVLPMDAGSIWYRYHPLLADCLQRRLAEQAPGRQRLLASRASDWCAEANLAESAAEYALLSEDSRIYLRRVSECVAELISRAQFATVCRWLRAVPRSELARRPDLLTREAWGNLYANNFTAAEGALADLYALRSRGVEIPLAERLSESILRVMLLMQRQDFDTAREVTDSALALLDEEDRHTLVRITNLRGMLAQLAGQFEEASLHAERVLVAAAREPPIWPSFLHACHIGGLVRLSQGKLADARRLFQLPERQLGGLEGAAKPFPPQLLAMLAAPLAFVAYEHNKLDDAEDILDRHEPFLNDIFSPSSRTLWHQLRARLCAARDDEPGFERVLREGRAYASLHGFGWMDLSLQWERIYHDLLAGRVSRARARAPELLAEMRLSEPPRWIQSSDEIFGAVTGAIRYFVHAGESELALTLLQPQIAHSEAQQRRLRLCKLKVLQAMAHDSLQQREPAAAAIGRAVELGMTCGFVRSFIDEGPGCLKLLREASRRSAAELGAPLEAYRRHVIASFEGAETPGHAQPLGPQPAGFQNALTERELQILQRLAKGHSNLAVGQQLFLSPNTIKWHLSQIYTKLNVKNRTQAVHVAQQQNLIPAQ